MSAKKTAKKKLTPRAEANKRYRANKLAREAAALIDSVILPPDLMPPVHTVIPSFEEVPPIFDDADNFNEFAPNFGMGEDPIDQETGEFRGMLKTDEPIDTGDGSSWVDAEEEYPADAISLHAPYVVVPSAPSPGVIVPQALPDTLEPPSDALVVERLINGINHLYGFAKTIKGIRGPQPDHIARIQANLIQARALLARLK